MVVDTQGVQKGCKETAAAVDGLAARVTGASAALKALAGAAVVGGLAKATSVVVGLASEAAALEEGMNKLDAVFGKSSKRIQDSSRDLAGAFGISVNEVVSDMGRIGSMLGGAGFDQAKSATMSDSLVKLANDLSRFNDTSFEEAFQKLRSGLAGEAEPLRDFGVFLTEGAVKARAYKLGLATLGSELTESQKIQARANIIFEQAGPAIGAAAREADGTSAKLAALSGRWTNLKIAIGETFAPAVGTAVGGVNDVLKVLESAWRYNANAAEDWGDRSKKAAEGVKDAMPKPEAQGPGFVETTGVAMVGAWRNANQLADRVNAIGNTLGDLLMHSFIPKIGVSKRQQEEDYLARQKARRDVVQAPWASTGYAEHHFNGKLSAPAIPGASTPFLDKSGIAVRGIQDSIANFRRDFGGVGWQPKGLWAGLGRTLGDNAVDSIKHGLDAVRIGGGGVGAMGSAASTLLGGPKGAPRDVSSAQEAIQREAVMAGVAAVKPMARAFAAGFQAEGLGEAISRAFGRGALDGVRGAAHGLAVAGGLAGREGYGAAPKTTDFTSWIESVTRKKPVSIAEPTSALRLGSAEATRAMATARMGGSRDPVAKNTSMTVQELKKHTRALNKLNTAREAPPVFVA